MRVLTLCLIGGFALATASPGQGSEAARHCSPAKAFELETRPFDVKSIVLDPTQLGAKAGYISVTWAWSAKVGPDFPQLVDLPSPGTAIDNCGRAWTLGFPFGSDMRPTSQVSVAPKSSGEPPKRTDPVPEQKAGGYDVVLVRPIDYGDYRQIALLSNPADGSRYVAALSRQTGKISPLIIARAPGPVTGVSANLDHHGHTVLITLISEDGKEGALSHYQLNWNSSTSGPHIIQKKRSTP